MSTATHVTLDWADGVYTFRLPIAQLEEHDEKCGAGPLEVLRRLAVGTWRVPDLRETIRLGLIGGGTPPADALKLTRRYVDAQPLAAAVPIAMVILAAAVQGETVEDVPGKPAAAKPQNEPDPTGLTSPPSAETPSPSGSASPISMP